ncbi:hypothetical protein I6I18_09205 [Kytococcus sedentarius]|uniref:Uncharacterized protein n=1 Tax=Kytococcus sedentarius (strain ATCC 14392 / DSM 20547 / JCM 11482 / CCUG 33030 / NBRC 15357 / NCTC 11040 / CCM 314 / 541) TaxID=478801 RepID=C7NM29_KYTSD|nr:hypothetical protein [Kytococcus sedentarius]ACV07278.1 hypothetical protein Ksed_23020 [Kytococcus sedentarius DSM 20547]QQB63243.1 hypothetical protein I6I18_09205 [Kytococcus sedentarius]STX13883.1 Uncharacterised protein [Kytococcus sedentarius]
MLARQPIDGNERLTSVLGTLLLTLKLGFTTLLANVIVTGLMVVVLLVSEGTDDLWSMWGLLGGTVAFLNVVTLYPVLGQAANSVPLSRAVVAAMFLMLVGGIAVVSGIAAGLLGRFEPPPAALGDAWWAPTLLVFAAGAWVAAWVVPLMFVGLLPVPLALLVAMVLCAVSLAGAAAPMLLVSFGTESWVNLALLSPLVTVPALAVFLFVVPLQRLAPRSH